MSRPETPLDPRQGPLESFAYDLRQLRRRSGTPAYRELAQIAGFSSTTLSTAARGERLPTMDVCLAYVRSCGGDPAQWEERWHRVAQEIGAQQGAPFSPPVRAWAPFVTSVPDPPENESRPQAELSAPHGFQEERTGGPETICEEMRSRVKLLERRLWQVLAFAVIAPPVIFCIAVALQFFLLMRM